MSTVRSVEKLSTIQMRSATPCNERMQRPICCSSLKVRIRAVIELVIVMTFEIVDAV